LRVQRRLVGIDLGIASAHTVRVWGAMSARGREQRQCGPGRIGPVVVRILAFLVLRRILGVVGAGPIAHCR
jgi:hypothetical protein